MENKKHDKNYLTTRKKLKKIAMAHYPGERFQWFKGVLCIIETYGGELHEHPISWIPQVPKPEVVVPGKKAPQKAHRF